MNFHLLSCFFPPVLFRSYNRILQFITRSTEEKGLICSDFTIMQVRKQSFTFVAITLNHDDF